MNKVYVLMSRNPSARGGVENYNDFLVQELSKIYDKVILVYTIEWNIQQERIWPSNIDVIHLKLSENKFMYFFNIMSVKKFIKKIDKDDIFIHSYYFLTGISKKNKGRITQIQHSNPIWIKKYLTGNFLRRFLFKKGIKEVNTLIRYPGSEILLDIFKDIKQEITIYPPHRVISNVQTGKEVIWAGRVDNEHKNYDFAMEVVELCPGIKFNFWGGGKDADDLNEKILSIPNAKYHGVYKSEEIEGIYKGNFLQICTSNSEGFPLSILEARAAGMSVLSRSTFSSSKFMKEKGVIDVANTPLEFSKKIINKTIKNEEYDQISKRKEFVSAIRKAAGK